jgi:hypothetical protein
MAYLIDLVMEFSSRTICGQVQQRNFSYIFV